MDKLKLITERQNGTLARLKLEDKINELQRQVNEKTEQMVEYKELQSLKQNVSDIIKEEADKKQFIINKMVESGIKKVELEDGRGWYVSSSQSVKIIDGSIIPEEYKKTTVKTVESIDKISIKNDLKNGVIIDGAEINTKYDLKLKKSQGI